MTPQAAQKLIFATRATLAALLAALVAFLVDLPQASTSMMTVFIVSQPLAGMVLSKSLFRIVGTVTGAIVAVALTDAFSEAPELFALAISLWIGLCVTTSVFMRDAPAAYGALLSGYTAAIVAFPAVGAPDTVFQAALDRTAEIIVGIGCATMLSQTFFPQTAANALKRATDAAVASANAWAVQTLRGRPEAAIVARQRRALVADVSKLENLRMHASFDSSAVRWTNRRIRLLHGRLVSFLALLVSVHDRQETLRAERPERAAALTPLLERAAAAMSKDATGETREAARAALKAALPDFDAMRRDRDTVFERTILLRVSDLVEMHEDIARLAAPAALEAAGDPEEETTLARYRDASLALVSGATAAVAMLAICVFWIASGWSAGAGAAVMVAVMTSLFAQQDDPARSAGVFLAMTALGTVVAAVYVFGVLPQLEGFEALALALAPLLFAAGFVMADARTALPALASAIGSLNLVGLANVMTPDFVTFSNSAIAQICGIGLAAVLMRTLRPIGSAWPIARLTSGFLSDLSGAVAGRRGVGRVEFESRMFDRIDGLMTRLDLSDPDNLAVEQGALAGLRVGLNALALRRVVRDLPAELSASLADALADLARHLRRLSRGVVSAPPLARLDAALDKALEADLGDRADAVDLPVWISAIRMSLSQHPRMFGEAPALKQSYERSNH